MTTHQPKRCILHIGITKTGSSSIQEFLFNHLDDERFHYAHCNGKNFGKALHHAFNRNAPNIDRFNIHNYTEQDLLEKQEYYRDLLLSHIQDNPNKTIIISAEALARFDPDRLKDVIEFLEPHFDRIEAVGYVRSPKSHIESEAQQRIKAAHKSIPVLVRSSSISLKSMSAF